MRDAARPRAHRGQHSRTPLKMPRARKTIETTRKSREKQWNLSGTGIAARKTPAGLVQSDTNNKYPPARNCLRKTIKDNKLLSSSLLFSFDAMQMYVNLIDLERHFSLRSADIELRSSHQKFAQLYTPTTPLGQKHRGLVEILLAYPAHRPLSTSAPPVTRSFAGFPTTALSK